MWKHKRRISAMGSKNVIQLFVRITEQFCTEQLKLNFIFRMSLVSYCSLVCLQNSCLVGSKLKQRNNSNKVKLVLSNSRRRCFYFWNVKTRLNHEIGNNNETFAVSILVKKSFAKNLGQAEATIQKMVQKIRNLKKVGNFRENIRGRIYF